MTKLMIILSVLMTLSIQASKSCYETLTINGQAVEKGPIEWRNLTVIEEKESSSFYALETKKPLMAHMVVLFTGYQKPWYGYHSFIAFKDIGHWKYDNDHISYLVDEDILLEENYRLKKVDHRLELNYVSNNEYLSGNVTYASRIRGMDGQKTFELKKVPCPSDMLYN